MTAETAVVLPVLVGFTLGLVWLVSVAVTQVRVVDAARETARALARDEQAGVAVELGRRVAPEGARIHVQDGADEVRVAVVASVRGPGGLFGFLPALEVDARSVAAKEPR
ncbi:MAG: TadE family type IV pilus minor pilin [Nocardioidaceae bacterium]